jgi:hypothetical protein
VIRIKKKKGKKKKKSTEWDINNSTMCSVRAHEILRDTMYPESVSVEGIDSYIKGERTEQDRGRVTSDQPEKIQLGQSMAK